MLATLVNASTNAVQVFALIAVILFIIAGSSPSGIKLYGRH